MAMTGGVMAKRIGTITTAVSLLMVLTSAPAAVAGTASAANPVRVEAVAGVGEPAGHLWWAKCDPPGPHLQCAHVQVPLDWSQPRGPRITLAVSRYLASDPAKVIGALFFNPGGPGVSGVDTLRQAGAGLEAAAGGRFNIVSWDPRGTGASTRVRCSNRAESDKSFYASRPLPVTKRASQQYMNGAIAFARRCGQVSGALLSHISTADTARDLNYLRQLTGDQPLTYLGWSYGTFLGATYANLFPHEVRAMILDGAIDPVAYTSGAEAAYLSENVGTDLVFSKFESLCQRAGKKEYPLAARGPVAAGVHRLFARLRRTPIRAPSAGPPRQLSYGDMLVAIFSYLGNPAQWPTLAQGLSEAEGGDGSALLRTAQHFYKDAPSVLPAAAALGCANTGSREPARAWPQVIGRLSANSYLYGPANGWWLWAPCASWPARSVDNYTGPWNAVTKNPILVIGTTFDPNTSYTGARRLAHRLGNAVLLTLQGYGHTRPQDPSRCIERAIQRYLVGLVRPARGTVCKANRLPFS
jgi:pimeloyl-ACP methyl ester carboxylesterase